MIRVLLADDHAVVRQGLRTFLDLQEDIEVVGEAGDGQAAVDAARRTDPDVILLADADCCEVDAAEVASRPGWEQMSAVQAERIIALDEDIASRWGPRIVDFLEMLAADLEAMDLVELEAAR